MPRSTDVSLELLLENKKEYLQHLHQLLTEPMYAEIQALYQVAQKQSAADKLLEGFQDQLTKIPHWNADQVLALKERVYLRMKCDYFQELVKATFMVFMKLHLATLAETPSHLKVKVPNMETYLHRVLVAVARLLWKKPYILYHNVRTLEKQKNLLQCEAMIHKAIGQTIQGSLPLNEIFRVVSQETRVRPKAAAADDESPDSATDATGEEQSDAASGMSEEQSDASEEEASDTSGEESDASGEEQSDASEEEASDDEPEESKETSEESETETEQSDAVGKQEIKPVVMPIVKPVEPVEPVRDAGDASKAFGEAGDAINASDASDASGYKSDDESNASNASKPSQPVEADLNLIKPIEITEKDSAKRLRRPHIRPMVSKLPPNRPSNAFF